METENIIILNLCETEMLFLKPDVLYKFEVAENCTRCQELKEIAEEYPK